MKIEKNMSDIIVIDEIRERFQENNLFNSDIVKDSAGDQFWPYFHQLSLNNKIECVTIDKYIRNSKNFDKCYLISHQPTLKKSKNNLNRKIINTILYSGESPQNSKEFHSRIYDITSNFKNSILFRGLHNYVHPNCKSHNFFWPVSYNSTYVLPKKLWSEKKLLAFIASPKSNISINYDNIFSRFISKPRHYFNKLRYFNNSIFKFDDLYETRFKIISHLAESNEFYLYGRNWNSAIKYNKLLSGLNLKNNPTESQDKAKTISEFKYVLCIENTILDGYITEKIFDAMIHGSVPIYLGAPDIKNIVPGNCFINLSNFDMQNNLIDHLKCISLEEWNMYRENINNYLNSNDFKKHKIENIAKQFFDITFSEIQNNK
jgi:hypothetical protein